MQKYKDTEYLHATARVRAMENTMLDAKALVKMVDAKNAAEAYKVLAEAAIGQGYELADYEQAFTNNLLETYTLVAKISPMPGLADLFRYKYDGHNLKVLIKSRRLDRDYSALLSPLGNVPADELSAGLDAGSMPAALAPTLAQAGLDAQEQMAKTGDPQAVDITIDRAVLGTMTAAAKAMDNAFLSRLVQAQADIANIRAAIRLKRMKKEPAMLKLVLAEGGTIATGTIGEAYAKGYDELLALISASPYGTALEPSYESLRGEQPLSLFEKLCDNYIASLFGAVKLVPFGIEPLVAYLYGKEWETNAARIVLASKLAGVPAAQITERLRDAYA
ncbi:MAG: V-type ATPase subunit [Angelakisella sp.]